MGVAHYRLLPGCLQVSSKLLQLGLYLLHLIYCTWHLLLFVVVHLILIVVQKAFKLDPPVCVVSSLFPLFFTIPLHLPLYPPLFLPHHPYLPFLQLTLCSFSL